MKMINDLDMYYANMNAKSYRPIWEKAERLDFCESAADNHGIGAFLSSLFRRK